jgi:long-chain fatty acid transport protein
MFNVITKKEFLVCFISILLALFSVNAWSFGLPDRIESTSDAGEASAGGAAIAEDASTNFFNPAGLTRIEHMQITNSLIGIFGSRQFRGTTLASYPGSSSASFTQTDVIRSSEHPVAPTLYFVAPLSKRLFFGFGITPQGIDFEYPDSSFVRYASYKSITQMINFNANVAFKFTEKVSLGYGVNLMRVSLTNNLKILNFFNAAGPDWDFKNYANGIAYGYNAGLLWQMTPVVRLGVSYRSKLEVTTAGRSQIDTYGTVSGASPPFSNTFQASFTVPPITDFSVYAQITPRWAIMGTVEYQQWSIFDEVKSTNLATPTGGTFNYTTTQDFRNTARYALGTNFQVNPKLKVRFGVAFDPSAVSNAINRSLVTPFDIAWALATGIHYQFNKNFGGDLAFSHQVYETAKIDYTNLIDATTGFFSSAYATTERGTVSHHNNIIAAQLSYNLD